MIVSRHPDPQTARLPWSNRGSPGDPLTALLRQAMRQTDDPAVRAWLRRMLRAEASEGRIGATR